MKEHKKHDRGPELVTFPNDENDVPGILDAISKEILDNIIQKIRDSSS